MDGIPPIAPFLQRLDALTEKMNAPDFYNDQRTASAVSREHQQLADLKAKYEELEKLFAQIEENKAIIEDESADAEFKELAKEDLQSLESSVEPLKKEILRYMIPPEETDSRNTVVEIRAGTGGDEASLFAADLYRMYSRYADRKGWKVEQLSSSESPAGGFKEVCFLLSGRLPLNEIRKRDAPRPARTRHGGKRKNTHIGGNRRGSSRSGGSRYSHRP